MAWPKYGIFMRFLRPAILILSVAGSLGYRPALATQPAEVSFAATIKPILARRCFACHGPDVENGGLRLHNEETALAELDSGGQAIVPGRPDESLLLARVSAEDESERMPPEGKPLTPEEIEPSAMDRARRQMGEALGVRAAQGPHAAGSEG